MRQAEFGDADSVAAGDADVSPQWLQRLRRVSSLAIRCRPTVQKHDCQSRLVLPDRKDVTFA
jgi:hypothetical protein